MNILVYHNGALGDFITTIPMLELLRKKNSGHIWLLGKPHFAQLAKAAGLIDEILDVNSMQFTPLFLDRFDPRVSNILNQYKRFVIFSDQDSPLVKNVLKITDSNILLQPPFPKENIHITNYHISLLNGSTIDDGYKFPEFHIPNSEQSRINDLFPVNKRVIAIGAGSGSKIKNWPLSRFIELSKRLKKSGYKIFWISGPAEWNFIFPESDAVIRDMNIISIAAVLRKCHAYIGNDSGLTHLAAFTGCKTVAIFGPSDPVLWRPLGRRVKIVYKKHLCSPCHLKKPDNKICNKQCMESITTDDVFEALNSIS